MNLISTDNVVDKAGDVANAALDVSGMFERKQNIHMASVLQQDVM